MLSRALLGQTQGGAGQTGPPLTWSERGRTLESELFTQLSLCHLPALKVSDFLRGGSVWKERKARG